MRIGYELPAAQNDNSPTQGFLNQLSPARTRSTSTFVRWICMLGFLFALACIIILLRPASAHGTYAHTPVTEEKFDLVGAGVICRTPKQMLQYLTALMQRVSHQNALKRAGPQGACNTHRITFQLGNPVHQIVFTAGKAHYRYGIYEIYIVPPLGERQKAPLYGFIEHTWAE